MPFDEIVSSKAPLFASPCNNLFFQGASIVGCVRLSSPSFSFDSSFSFYKMFFFPTRSPHLSRQRRNTPASSSTYEGFHKAIFRQGGTTWRLLRPLGWIWASSGCPPPAPAVGVCYDFGACLPNRNYFTLKILFI